MNSFTKIALCISIFLGINACERSDYTTWLCESIDHTHKTKFILDRSKMILDNETIRYCGSLGKVSYFNDQCVGTVGTEKIQFNTEFGQLNIGDRILNCKLL